MGYLYYLMGKSSSGKDTIYSKLLENRKLKLIPVVPYTTRPIRVGEKEGREYFFIDDHRADELMQNGKIIELREYKTCLGIWKYMTVDDGSLDFSVSSYLMIGTLESYLKVRNYYGANRVNPLYLTLDEGERLERALTRERRQEHPAYAELCRRYLADEQDFSVERLKAAGVAHFFTNENLKTCLSELEEGILQGAYFGN